MNAMTPDLNQLAEAYAKQISAKEIKEGYQLTTLHIYTDASGLPVYWKARFEHPIKGKRIKPFSQNESGQFQFKEPDFKSVYPDGNGKKPIYRLHEITAAALDAIVWIVEGEKVADALSALGIVATTSGGSNSVANTDWQPLAGRSVRIWRDNDDAGLTYQEAVKTALNAIGGNVSCIDVDALCLPDKGDDFCDWLAVRACQQLSTLDTDILALPLANSESVNSKTADEPTDSEILAEPMTYAGGRFEILKNGIFFVEKDKEGNERDIYISSPVLVLAMTRSNDCKAWGRLLKWHDADHKQHTWAMPMDLLQGDGTDVRKELASQGVQIHPNRRNRELFLSYLQTYPTDKRALCVDRLGWHGNKFVLPDGLNDDGGDITVFQNSHSVEPAFSQKGTVTEWRNTVGRYAIGNSRLVFSISLSLAGALAELANEQSGGFHLRGSSSTGKSTALKIACSIWGNPNEYRREWRATTNGLEGLAVLHNDGLLVLDEINQCDPRDVGQAVYMLANGQGKTRMARTGSTKKAATWRVLVLSAGEKSLSSIMNEAGKTTNAGQEIRLADIPSDAGKGFGLFENLHKIDTAPAFATTLNDATAQHYGAVGIEWLQHLTSDRSNATTRVLSGINEFLSLHLAKNHTGQVARVARRFALVATAGEMATDAGLTGWQSGEAIAAAAQCFNDWLAGFGAVGNHEERAIFSQIRSFMEAHGSSRFESMTADRERINNRVGYIRNNQKGEREYLVFPEQFKNEVCKGLDHRQVERVLLDCGWLQKNERSGATCKVRVPDQDKPPRMYILTSKLWSDEDNTEQHFYSGNAGNSGNKPENKGFEPVPTPKSEVGTVGTNSGNSEKLEGSTNPVPTVPSSDLGVGTDKTPLNTIVFPAFPVFPAENDSSNKTGDLFL